MSFPDARGSAQDETEAAARLAFEEASAWLSGLDERQVLPEGAEEAAASFGGPLPEEGSGAVDALRELVGGLDAATASPGPRFFHFVIGGVTPAALGADWLTTALDADRHARTYSGPIVPDEQVDRSAAVTRAIDWLRGR